MTKHRLRSLTMLKKIGGIKASPALGNIFLMLNDK